jgi:hypothetical protein
VGSQLSSRCSGLTAEFSGLGSNEAIWDILSPVVLALAWHAKVLPSATKITQRVNEYIGTKIT